MDWGALFSTLGLVFVAELGDKTQLAVVTQVCKYRRPGAVFLGASLALTGVTALGAVGGRLVGRVVPPSLLQVVSGLAFVVMGLLIGREVARSSAGGPEDPACDLPADAQANCEPGPAWDWRAFGSTLGLLFVAELGDKTQLAVLSLAGKVGKVWPVFLGGASALTLVTALGVLGGQSLCRLLPERALLWLSAVAFVVMGALIGFGLF